MDSESLREFKKTVKKVSKKRGNAKIRGSLGVYDAYKWMRKQKWLNIGRPVKEKEFYAIIRRYHELLGDAILSGRTVTLPQKMGVVELKEKPPVVKMVDGKLQTNLPIDWNSTLNLWYEDEECRIKKTLVHRDSSESTFKIVYSYFEANYPNKSFFKLYVGRRLVERKRHKELKGDITAAFLMRRKYLEI